MQNSLDVLEKIRASDNAFDSDDLSLEYFQSFCIVHKFFEVKKNIEEGQNLQFVDLCL